MLVTTTSRNSVASQPEMISPSRRARSLSARLSAGSASNGGGRFIGAQRNRPTLACMAEPVNRFSPPPAPPKWPEPRSASPQGRPGQTAGFYPLTVSRVVSLALSLFRFGWKTFVAINLIVAVPVGLITAILTVATLDELNRWQELLLTPTSDSLDLTANAANLVSSFPWGVAAATFVLSLFLGAIAIIGSAALTHAIATAFGGGRLSTRESYRVALSKLRELLALYVVLTIAGAALALLLILLPLLLVDGPTLLGGGGLLSFLALLGIVAVVFVTVFLVIRFVFAIQVMVLEDLSAVPSLRRSYALVAGSMLRVIGYSIVFGLILGVIGLAISFVSLFIGLIISPANLTTLTPTFSPASTFAQSLVTSLLAEVFAPIFTIGFVLLYYDTRYRHGEQVPGPGGRLATPETRG